MQNENIEKLISSFIEYKNLLTPIQSDMHEFLSTYTAVKSDIENLSKTFDGDARSKLDEIYKSLASQARKSEELTRKVDEFLKSSNKYTEEVDKLISTFEGIQNRISSVNEIEKKAEEQIGRLDSLIEEKRRMYNIKELQKSLDSYNTNIQAVGDFVNKDIAENIVQNSRLIQSIKDGSDNILKLIIDEHKSIEDLLNEYKSSNEFLSKIVTENDVNEEYVFDMLDRWALSRNVKIKKK